MGPFGSPSALTTTSRSATRGRSMAVTRAAEVSVSVSAGQPQALEGLYGAYARQALDAGPLHRRC